MLEAQGSNRIFSGKGFIKVPYLNDTKLSVSFENIKINTDNQLIEGVVKTTYDPSWGSVVDIPNIKTISEAVEFLEAVFKKQENTIKNITKLEKKQLKVTDSKKIKEIQQEIEEEYKKWREEQIKIIKIARFVASSPAISEKEKEELEKKTQESENKNQKISSQNLKKSSQKNKEISEISKNVQKKENKNIAETKKKLEKFSKNEQICEDWVNVKDGKFGRFQLNYIAHQKCTHGTLYRLENNTYIFHTQYNLYHTHYQNEKPREHFYIYVADLQSWVEFI